MSETEQEQFSGLVTSADIPSLPHRVDLNLPKTRYLCAHGARTVDLGFHISAVELGLLVVNNELSLLSLFRPTLFEIQLGQVDRGATLRWISQFPEEEEVLLPPLSNLEVVGEPVLIQTMAGDPLRMGTVKVVQMRVNINLKVKP